MIKITVLKRTYFRDLIQEYALSAQAYPECEIFKEGQVFFTASPDEMPQGFCDWAWKNLQPELHSCMEGISLDWVKQEHTFIACCTDGFRPVIFKIQLIDQ